MLQFICCWKIIYYDEKVEKDLLDLPDTLLARYLRLSELMMNYGPNIGMPHTKALRQGLFELRLNGKEGIARVFFCAFAKKNICMLHCMIKKTNEIPLQDLRLARSRLKEVENDS